jgi:hypothetical protein
MRLRAVLHGGRRLQEVLRALERVSKTVTVLMSATEIALVANPNAVESLKVWAVLAAVSLKQSLRLAGHASVRAPFFTAFLCVQES